MLFVAPAATTYCTRRLVALVNTHVARDFKTIRTEIIYLIISILLSPNLQHMDYELHPLNYLLDSLSAVGVFRVLKEPRTHTLRGNRCYESETPSARPTTQPPFYF